MRQSLNDGWMFAKGAPDHFAPVALPHDWLIHDARNLYESGVGWYRRVLKAGFFEAGQRVFLRFDGVYMDSTLYVNGAKAGEWKYGYTAFEFDITDHLRLNLENTLLLRVGYQAQSARWYTGAGIYRDVCLKVKNPCHFVSDGIYVTTYQAGAGWRWEADAEVETGGLPFALRHTLLEGDTEIIPWDVDRPQLYTLRSELLVEGEVVDTEHTRFGFRTARFTPDRGFFLNGRPVKLHGVCLHHDLGSLGAAFYPDAARRQLSLLRGMGVNAIRTAHNPPAKAFMDLADEMGFLVMSEIFDVWQRPKTPNDYARYFDAWHERDVASWVRRDRNHPSLILWSIGNEIHDTHADAKQGGKTLRRLMDLVRANDPKGHAGLTFCSNYMPWENTQRCADMIKLIGYNYADRLYGAHHSAHPDWILYGGETCSTVQSRGIYHFPLAQPLLADDDLQCSALGNSATSWGAESVEACLYADRDTPYSLGQFIWAGQDYLGEPTPYHTKNAYFGHLDTAGFPKDSYYLFKAAWTDFQKEPVVHVYPYWDFSPGQVVDVRVCSNAAEVELFVNGESQGRRRLVGRVAADFRVPYAPGILRAVAYGEDGAPAAEMCRHSFGDAASLRAETETVGQLTFATISALDRDGFPVENANRRVSVQVQGGTLLGLDNGDSTDYDSYKAASRRLFSGKLLAIVQADGEEPPRITAALDDGDIPVRKVELAVEGYAVWAKTFPPDATYDDLRWRLTNAAGIDSPLATLAVAADGRSAAVLPRGDGEVYVRCGPLNGREHWAFIAQMPLRIEGKGKSLLNPYGFLSAGLYDKSNVTLTNGNERGVATPRDGESHVGFTDLDFGSYGADTITLWLFPLDREPFAFEIWEGMPLEGGTKLYTARYDKGSIWNTYQAVTYRLPQRLRGVTTLCLVFRQKVHIKGFCFARSEKAYARLDAAEYDAAYGDAFTVSKGAVERIGNNVTLVYEGMDFGGQGASTVTLCYCSRQAQNFVQLLFAGDGAERRVMIEVAGAQAYTSQTYPLGHAVTGWKTVSLLFLPGTDLDLAWLQFSKQ